MVQERITDGNRIAELLIAEIRGRQTGSFETLSTTSPADENNIHTICVIEEELDSRREPNAEVIEAEIAEIIIKENSVHIVPKQNKQAVLRKAKDQGLDRSEDGVIVTQAAEIKRCVDAISALTDG